jgi:hypothetical protein
MKKHTEAIMRKQCEIAHVDFDIIDFKDEQWFHEYTWTQAQEDEFKDWVVGYLQDSVKARREVSSMPSIKSKKYLEKWWTWWNLMYGFRIKED